MNFLCKQVASPGRWFEFESFQAQPKTVKLLTLTMQLMPWIPKIPKHTICFSSDVSLSNHLTVSAAFWIPHVERETLRWLRLLLRPRIQPKSTNKIGFTNRTVERSGLCVSWSTQAWICLLRGCLMNFQHKESLGLIGLPNNPTIGMVLNFVQVRNSSPNSCRQLSRALVLFFVKSKAQKPRSFQRSLLNVWELYSLIVPQCFAGFLEVFILRPHVEVGNT